MNQQEALVALNAVSGLGTVRINALLRSFGSALNVMTAAEAQIRVSGILPEGVIQNLVNFSKDKFIEAEYNRMREKGVVMVTILDEAFPSALKGIPGCPLVLYVLGNPSALSKVSIGMVGSRAASYYGQKISFDFAYAFAKSGVTVVSGLARGIDTSAHQGCLKANFPTVAVLGCGFNYTYPMENAPLYQAIVNAGGALITELPMDVAPAPGNFPPRNRIISGLSMATLVVEAQEKSGALITVDYALEQGKDVFAVPGPIDSLSAKGSNRLIKDGAKVALSPQDVLEALGVELMNQDLAGDEAKVALSGEEYRGYRIISTQPMHIEQLVVETGWILPKVQQVMLGLELKQVVRQLPGQYYVRT